MQSGMRDVYNAIKAELDEHGIGFTFEDTKKHSRILFKVNGHPLIYIIGRSPSCTYAATNARADVRRMIKTAKSEGVKNGVHTKAE